MASATDYRCVGAIDFGTTYSGWAYSFTSDPDDVHLYWDWGQCLGIPRTCKAPTSVLVNDKGELEAFGYEAYNKFYNTSSHKVAKYSFFSHYKMHLHDTVPLTLNTDLKAIGGKTHSAHHIFAITLQYLSDSLMREVRKNSDYRDLQTSDIQWIITVPAIWSEESKKFMRYSAAKGGLVRDPHSSQLVIALEPEAASLHCHTLNIDVFDNTGQSQGRMVEGTKYLVLDCGGGTLDITAHELLPDHKVEELYHVSGGALGGMLVNKNFEHLMSEIFGENIINEFREINAPAWIQMINQFEVIKRSIDPYNPTPSMSNINLHLMFVRFFEKKMGANIETAFTAEWECKGIVYLNGQLQLSYNAMNDLYQPAITKIMDFVINLLQKEELKTITHLLLVGGFGESKLLQDAVKMKFQDRFRILVPQDASQCVLKGALKFAFIPETIIARRARKTYGYNSYTKFDSKIHHPKKFKEVDGVKYAGELFCIFVHKNERVAVGDQKIFHLYPLWKGQTHLTVGLFNTDDDKPKYVDEDGVIKLRKLDIKLPGEGKDRQVKLHFAFGNTEIDATLIDPREGGDAQGTKIDFFLEEA